SPALGPQTIDQVRGLASRPRKLLAGSLAELVCEGVDLLRRHLPFEVVDSLLHEAREAGESARVCDYSYTSSRSVAASGSGPSSAERGASSRSRFSSSLSERSSSTVKSTCSPSQSRCRSSGSERAHASTMSRGTYEASSWTAWPSIRRVTSSS